MSYKIKVKSPSIVMKDEELVKAILRSNNKKEQRQLQEELYNRYAGRVYYKCKSMVKVDAVAKDLSHDILIKVFLQLNKFRGESTFYSWVTVIAYHHCISYLEKEKRLVFDRFESHDYNISADESELENKLLEEAQFLDLEKAVKHLKPAERLILMMHYQDGLRVKAIAKKLKIGESAVKMRLKRSREHLAQLIKEMNHESTK